MEAKLTGQVAACFCLASPVAHSKPALRGAMAFRDNTFICGLSATVPQQGGEMSCATFENEFGAMMLVLPWGSTIPQYASLTTLWITVFAVPVQLKLNLEPTVNRRLLS